jgi:hypothetical protein
MRDRHSHAAELRDRLAADPAAPWRIAEARFSPDRLGAHESVFAVGNGYVGVRGAPEEGTPAHDPGVVLNGFHETWPIVYPEDAYGLARTGQTIVNATDGSIVRLFVDDEPFDLASVRIVRFERVLDMALGVLVREVEWETARGARVLVRSRRLASLADRHLAAFDYEVVALDTAVRITISSELVTHAPESTGDDPRRGKGFAEKVLVPVASRAGGDRACSTWSRATAGWGWPAGWRTASTCPPPPPPKATARASSWRPRWRPASRCACRSSSRTTGRRARRRATWPHAPSARSTAPWRRATTRSRTRTAASWTSSGAAPTCRSTATPRSSRRCASTSSS